MGGQQGVDRFCQRREALLLGEDHVELGAARVLRNSPANTAKPMIFVPANMRRRANAVSIPYSIGMLRSRITKAGARSLAFSMAATLSPASQQALKGVVLSMKLQMASRTAALSSTTRIQGFWGVTMRAKLQGLPDQGNTNFPCFSCTVLL